MVSQVTNKQSNKLDKLKKIQLSMIKWLSGKGIDKTNEHNDTWQKRLAYVLSCEKKDLDKDDIKMLNTIWNHYR
jgi:hypothetical protein